MNAELIRLVVGVSGKEVLREKIESAEGRLVSDEELNREWTDLTKTGGPDLEPDADQHLSTIVSLVDGAAAYLRDSHWTLISFERRSVLTSDRPVSLVTGPDYPSWRGVGIATAEMFLVPLSRRAALIIQPRWSLEEYGYPAEGVPDFRRGGTTTLARSINHETSWRARRYVFHHPQEDPLDRIELPDSENETLPPSSSSDHLINEKGIFHGLNDSDRKALSSTRSPSDKGFSMDDLSWPLPGRIPPG